MDILKAIEGIVGPRNLVPGSDLRDRPLDFWNKAGTEALGLVKPRSVEEVAAVLSLCNDRGQRVIVEGGRTNIVKATLGTKNTLLMSLEHLHSIEAPDARNMTVEAGAGVVLENLQASCLQAGTRFGLDFGARGSATLGGALAMNAGGFQALRYGVARDQVLGIECVLPDGTILSHLSPHRKDNTGYDLKHLFIGSEGTLGVITRAVLKLHPAPETVSTALLAFDHLGGAIETLQLMRRDLRGVLSSFEVIWQRFFELNVSALFDGRSPIQGRFPLYVLCEAEGFNSDSDPVEFEDAVRKALEAGHVVDAIVATSERQRRDLWRLREDFEAEAVAFMVTVEFDVTLALNKMEAFVDHVKRRVDDEVPENLGLHIIGHLGDGNLHLTFGLADDDEKTRVQDIVYRIVSEHAGSISAEHGIGMSKKPFLMYSRSPAEIEVMKSIKKALDPNSILNPGKIFD
jgi:FAD/FMN-containing dehydrogenase